MAPTIKTTVCMSAHVVRTCIDTKNIYDGHHDLRFEYRQDDRLMAITSASGYPHNLEFDCISTCRPPRAGKFSNGKRSAYFSTLDEMDEYIMSEIEKGIIKAYD